MALLSILILIGLADMELLTYGRRLGPQKKIPGGSRRILGQRSIVRLGKEALAFRQTVFHSTSILPGPVAMGRFFGAIFG
jgi:hypothetical protein